MAFDYKKEYKEFYMPKNSTQVPDTALYGPRNYIQPSLPP